MTNNTVRKRVKLAMNLAGVTYEKMANEENLTKSSIATRINGSKISIGTLDIVSNATGVPIDWFITSDEYMFNNVLNDLLKAKGYVTNVVEEV